MDKILFIRLSSLGDILLTTPVVRAVKRKFPRAEIHFLTKKMFFPLLTDHPAITSVRPLSENGIFSLLALRKEISRQYDLVVDCHKNLRSFVLTGLMPGTVVKRYQKRTIQRAILVHFKKNLLLSAPSLPSRYLSAVESLGVTLDNEGLDFYGNEKGRENAETLLAGLENSTRVALAPGAKWKTKEWPIEKFSSLINSLPDFHFVVLGDDRDIQKGNVLKTAHPDKVTDLTGRTDISTVAEIIRQCRGLVSNDSGLMHLGTAVKTPVVAVFGSTVREWGFFPYKARAEILESNLPCRPCTTIGRGDCKRGDFKCLEDISAEQVKAAVLKTF